MIIQVVSSTFENTSKRVAYADFFTAGSKTKDFNHWWKTLRRSGLKFGYFPNASKSWFNVKKELYEDAITENLR